MTWRCHRPDSATATAAAAVASLAWVRRAASAADPSAGLSEGWPEDVAAAAASLASFEAASARSLHSATWSQVSCHFFYFSISVI